MAREFLSGALVAVAVALVLCACLFASPQNAWAKYATDHPCRGTETLETGCDGFCGAYPMPGDTTVCTEYNSADKGDICGCDWMEEPLP